MKFFYVLANQFVSIFLSTNTITTLHFDSTIAYCDHGMSKEQLGMEHRRKRTSLSLVPKVNNIDSNMTCYMKNGEVYVFNLKWSDKRIHKNISIGKALRVKGGHKVLETKDFKLFDAGKNYYLENKTKKKLLVNESLIDKIGVASKWSPININGKDYQL